MLVVKPGAALQDRVVRELPDLLAPGDRLVVNDTRVIPARLEGVRVRGDAVAHIQATLHLREGPDLWRAFVRPAKRLAVGERIRFGEASESMACLLASLDAEVVEKGEGGEVLLRFAFAGPALDEAIARVGHIPLPPYIAAKRGEDDADRRDYQTLFADREGAVAAPTAGLHFTPALLDSLGRRGVRRADVTLHVGAGTFKPVEADDPAAHVMHEEWYRVPEAAARTLNETRAAGGHIWAVGTTCVRTLESAVRADGSFVPTEGDTRIFIRPPYTFRAVDRLVTNFHLPRSTLLMLVAAFAGYELTMRAYQEAIDAGYRFYSYGDAMAVV